MKKLSMILLILLILVSILSIGLPLAQGYTYSVVNFGDHVYDYYSTGKNDWVFVYLSGGIGYSDRVDGCLGSRDIKGNCIVDPRDDEWAARLFIDNKIDFIEPQKYMFKTGDVWPIQLISYLKSTYDYKIVMFGGFSGGGGSGLSLASSYGRNANWNITVVYAGPAYSIFTSGPLSSAVKASNTYTKTFLAYGVNDMTAPPYDGALYVKNMPSSVPKLLITVSGVGHDMALIPYTLDNLFAFVGKPRPPQYVIETSTISFTTEYTKTNTETSFISVTATTTAVTATEIVVTTSIRIVKSFAPNWEATRNAIIVMLWLAALILSVWFIRKKRSVLASRINIISMIIRNKKNENRKSESG